MKENLEITKGPGFTSPPPAAQGLLQQPAQLLVLSAHPVVQSIVPHAVHRPHVGSVAQEQFSHLGTAFLTGQDQGRSVGWDESEHRHSPWNPEALAPEIPLTSSVLPPCGQENPKPTPASDKASG